MKLRWDMKNSPRETNSNLKFQSEYEFFKNSEEKYSLRIWTWEMVCFGVRNSSMNVVQ